MTDTKAKLAAIYNADPEGFNRIVAAFNKEGPSALGQHPRHRTDTRKKRTPSVLTWIWASIEFLKWRDADSTINACKRLHYFYSERGKEFSIYQTDDYTWQVGREPEPETFRYAAPDWQGLKEAHNLFYGLGDEDQANGHFKFGLMKSTHNKEYEKLFPGWSPVRLERLVPCKPEDL